MKRKVEYLRAQTNLYFPGAGELGTVIPPAVKVLEGLSMYSLGADGVTVDFRWQGKAFSVWVPSSNIVLAVLAPETK